MSTNAQRARAFWHPVGPDEKYIGTCCGCGEGPRTLWDQTGTCRECLEKEEDAASGAAWEDQLAFYTPGGTPVMWEDLA